MNVEYPMSNVEVEMQYWILEEEDIGEGLLRHSTFSIRYLHEIPFAFIDQQFAFKKFGNFYNRIIVFAGSFLEFVRIN